MRRAMVMGSDSHSKAREIPPDSRDGKPTIDDMTILHVLGAENITA
jgi:hypothetical protein